MIAFLAVTGACGIACLIADMFTGTAIWQTNNREETIVHDQDTYLDPQDSADYWDHYLHVIEQEQATDPTEIDLDAFDDLDGVDVDGFGSDEDAMEYVENVAWLHSLAYSDYADPSDDDDRADMNIPRSILDRL